MKCNHTPHGPALLAVATALVLWVLLPAVPAVQANDADPGPMGQFIAGQNPPGPTGDHGGTDDSGGLDADPDTFQIDGHFGVGYGRIDAPAPPTVPGGPFGRLIGWLLAVFGSRIFGFHVR
jgi:hypothetical protein